MNKQPNWSEAPDGATLFWTNPFSYSPWFKIEKGMLYNFDSLDRKWCCMEDIKHRFEPHSFIKRPTDNHKLTVPVVNQEFTTEKAACSKMEPATLDGQGLPPVGQRVEISLGDFNSDRRTDGETGRVLSLSVNSRGRIIAMIEIDGADGECDALVVDALRPLRTERERWIDTAIGLRKPGACTDERWLSDIYDAGLAKLPE